MTRIMELAREQAFIKHSHYVMLTNPQGHVQGMNDKEWGFTACPHPDCVLVRADAAASRAPSVSFGDVVTAAFDLWTELKPYVPSGQLDNNPPARSVIERHLAKALAAGARAVPSEENHEEEAPTSQEAAGQSHVQNDAAARVEQAHRAHEGSGRPLGPFLVGQPKVLHELRNVDDDQPSAGLITECCGRWIEAHDRFCPQCGHECRVRREAKGPIEQMIDEGSIGTGPFRQAVPVQDAPELRRQAQQIIANNGRTLEPLDTAMFARAVVDYLATASPPAVQDALTTRIGHLAAALNLTRWAAAVCGACGEGYLKCRGCGVGIKAALRSRSSTDAIEQCGGHCDVACRESCKVEAALRRKAGAQP